MARYFCGSLALRIDDFLYFPEINFWIVKDRFFLFGITYCDFRKSRLIEIKTFSRLLKVVQ